MYKGNSFHLKTFVVLPAKTLSCFDTEAFGKVQKVAIVYLKLMVKSCILPFLVSFKKVLRKKWRNFKQPV